MATLRLKNINKDFVKVKALKNINLEIEEGTFCVVLGPSGCGKSTLLNLVAGLEEPSAGRIFLGNKDITEIPAHKRNVAMVFQNYALYPHLSVYENIAFGLRVKKEKEEAIKEKIEKTSRILNIENKLNKFPRQLSGGERQRVATGRAIVRQPELFLFDEPLYNLDARLRIKLREEFIKLHRQVKKTIIYVTHDQVEAMVLGKMIVVLKDGSVQQVSTPEGLYHNPANLFVAEFIGTPPMNIMQLKAQEANGSLMLTSGEFKLTLSGNFRNALREYVGEEIYFGFRPQAVRLVPDGQIKGEVIFTETIGEEGYAHIRFQPAIEITAKIDPAQKLNPQDLVAVSIDSARCFFFTMDEERISLS